MLGGAGQELLTSFLFILAGSGEEGTSVKAEAWRTTSLAVPLVAMESLQYLHTVLGLIFVGRLGAIELSAAILGGAIYSTSGFSIMVGLSSAMETFCGQAFGAEEYHVLGEVLQRASLVMAGVAVPIAWVWKNVEAVLVATGQQADIARMSAGYVQWIIPALFGIILTENAKCYLRSQNVVAPTVWITVVSLALSPPLFYLAIFKLEHGVNGAAMVSALLWVLQSAAFVGYIAWYNAWAARTRLAPATWKGFTKNALSGWKGYLKVAVPSAAMLCLEWWAFEIVVFMGGMLSEPELQVAAMGIGFNVIQVSFTGPYGLSQAVSVRTANELGAGNARAARLAAQVATLLSLGTCTLAATLILFFRRNVIGIFTSDVKITALAIDTFGLVAVAVAFDGLNTVLCGILRGSGRQLLGSLVVMVHYFVGLPVAALCAFHFHGGVSGLWLGLCTATLLEAVGLLWTVHITDWDQAACEAVRGTLHGDGGGESGGGGGPRLYDKDHQSIH